MSVKKKKSFASLMKKGLLYTGTIFIVLGFSYVFIVGAKFVENGIGIVGYNAALFICLPLLSFFIISVYMYILDRFIA